MTTRAKMAEVATELTPKQVQQSMVRACREGDISQLKQNRQQLTQANHPLINQLLDIAASFGHLEVMEWLVSQGADLHHSNAQNQTIAFSAAACNQFQTIAYLNFHQLQLSHRDHQDETCIFVAAARGHVKTIEWLLTHAEGFTRRLELPNAQRQTVSVVAPHTFPDCVV
jgi:ankyrin repeat protein